MHMRQETKTAEKSLLSTLILKYKNLWLHVIFSNTMNLDNYSDSRFLYFGMEEYNLSYLHIHFIHSSELWRDYTNIQLQ